MPSGRMYQMMFNFGAKVQASMPNAFNTAQKGIRTTNKGLSRMQREASLTQRAFSGMGGMFKTAFAGVGVYLGFSAIASKASETVEYAKAQIEAETKLEAVLQNVQSIQARGPEHYKKAKLELMGIASQLQGIGVIGDEVTLAGQQQMATFQMNEKEIGVLSEGMLDLLAQQKGLNATQQDAVNIGNMIGKVMEGQVGALSRVGISFDENQEKILKTGTRMERATVLAEVLRQNVGGVNKALAETPQGKIQQLSNSWGDMKEEIGKKILPLQAQFASWFITKVPYIQSIFLGGMDKISQAVSWVGNTSEIVFGRIQTVVENNGPAIENIKASYYGFKDAVVTGFETMRPYIEWVYMDGLPLIVDSLINATDSAVSIANAVIQVWPMMEPIVMGVVGALGAYKLIQVALILKNKAYVFSTKAAMMASIKFQRALTFLGSPIGMTVVAIGALIAIGWAVYKNWDTISAYISEVWANVKLKAAGVGEYISGAFQASYQAVTGTFAGIGDFFKGVLNGVTGIFKGGVNTYIGMANFLIDSLNSIKIDVPDWVPKIGGETIGFSVPNIPMLANGGIATGPTLAMIGEGAESEVIAPLSKLESFISSKVLGGSKRSSQSISVTFEPKVIIYGEASESKIRTAMSKANDDLEDRFNRLMANKKRLSFRG